MPPAILMPRVKRYSTHLARMLLSSPPQTLKASISFILAVWKQLIAWTLAWFQERQRASQRSGVSANGLSLNLLLGPDAAIMTHNFARNAQEGRIHVVQAVFERI